MPTVSAFWSDRYEERIDAAERLATCLRRLGDVDASLAHWRLKGGSRPAAKANDALPLDAEPLSEHLRTQRSDVERVPMPELGFSFAAWNGAEAAFACTVGLHAKNRNLRNSAVVSLPRGWPADSEKVRAVGELLREVWQPEEVVVFGEQRERVTLWTQADD